MSIIGVSLQVLAYVLGGLSAIFLVPAALLAHVGEKLANWRKP